MGRTKLLAVACTTAALAAACSSSKATTKSSGSTAPSTTTSSSAAAASSSAASASSPPSSSAAPAGSASSSAHVGRPALSGRWKGSYGGSFSGTFVLQWTQSSSKLSGTINLSTAPGAVPINGSVAGGRIQFGTVGSQAITYTGSVSGNSMSGHYQVAGGAGGSGTWSATRT